MRGYLIDANTDKCGPVDIRPSLKEYYRLIGCSCIDIAIRHINDTPLNIVLDDEGLLKPNRITATNLRFDEQLAGTLIVFGVEKGTFELRSLTEREELAVSRRIIQSIFADGSEHPVLWYSY